MRGEHSHYQDKLENGQKEINKLESYRNERDKTQSEMNDLLQQLDKMRQDRKVFDLNATDSESRADQLRDDNNKFTNLNKQWKCNLDLTKLQLSHPDDDGRKEMIPMFIRNISSTTQRVDISMEQDATSGRDNLKDV